MTPSAEKLGLQGHGSGVRHPVVPECSEQIAKQQPHSHVEQYERRGRHPLLPQGTGKHPLPGQPGSVVTHERRLGERRAWGRGSRQRRGIRRVHSDGGGSRDGGLEKGGPGIMRCLAFSKMPARLDHYA